MTPRVTVVIPHYNDLERLDRCLDALGAQTLPAGTFEIVVADNASPQGVAGIEAVVAGRARVILQPQKGAGPARNAGVAAAAAPLLAFTDADCLPEPGWLAAGIDALAGYDVVGGKMTVLQESRGPKSGAEAYEQVFAFDNRRYVEKEGFSVTANLFCPRAVFDAVGPFRTGVSEDVEWCRRATARGFRLGYAEGAVAGHPARRTWPELARKWERMSEEAYLLALESSRGGRLKWLARSWLLPPSIIAHVPKIWRSPALTSGAERRRALGTMARLRLWRLADAHRRVFGGRR